MKNKYVLIAALLINIIILPCISQDNKTYSLPEPDKTGGMPLMEALNNRQSSRQFTQKKLSKQQLSNLLWAADGINRPESGKRTAPSARNCQEIEIYVIVAEGVFVYQAENHTLKQVLNEDIRDISGKQNFVKDAPLNLLYIVDYNKTQDKNKENAKYWAYADAGFISQNVYLFCASEGLGTVVRGLFDADALASKLELPAHKAVILTQTVGFKNE
ncbi:MAG: SagB/ThcOx family dehydrogenase [Bacteroidales bacterium]|nr:SagB/ThcOx family dehydrogenase [Bacteroidales bacterium]